jgi:hypothetical protein
MKREVDQRHGREIFDDLRALDLPLGDFAIFGSGPLLVRGIIDEVGDLDVLCRGAAWDIARSACTEEDIDHGVLVVSLGALTFGTTWGIGDFDPARLIDEAELIDGLPFVRIEHVIAYKRMSGRSKDRQHLALIDASLARGGDDPWATHR